MFSPSAILGGGSFKWTSCCRIPMVVSCHPALRAGAYGGRKSSNLDFRNEIPRDRVTETACVLRCCFSHWDPMIWWLKPSKIPWWFRCDWTLLLSIMRCPPNKKKAQDFEGKPEKIQTPKVDLSTSLFFPGLSSVRGPRIRSWTCGSTEFPSMAGIDVNMPIPYAMVLAQISYMLVGVEFLCSLQQHGHAYRSLPVIEFGW